MKPKFNPWPLGIVLVFIVFISGMTTAVVIACTHRDHLVSENYYEQELRYDEQRTAAFNGQQSGATLVWESGHLKFQLPTAQGSTPGAEPATGVIKYYRPSAAAMDHPAIFAPGTDGSQILEVKTLAAGPWVVTVQWTLAGTNYLLEQKFTL
ncbi:MAG TPA: FixH family protein [Verrucomicrobiae bacterium]